jgi:hypothetical protein
MAMLPLVSAFQTPKVQRQPILSFFGGKFLICAPPYTFEVWGHSPATRSFLMLFKDGLSSLDSCQRVFNCLATEVNIDRSFPFNVSLAFTKVSKTATKKLQAKAKVILKKNAIFDPATLLTLNQDTIKPISNFCTAIILEEVTCC